MTSSNIVPLNSRLTIKAYIHGHQLAVLLIGGQHDEPLKYIKFQSLTPRASIQKESLGERSVYRLIIRNFDLSENAEHVADIVNVLLPSEEIALSALNSFYESLAQTLDKRSVVPMSTSLPPAPKGVSQGVVVSAIAALSVALVFVGTSMFYLSKSTDDIRTGAQASLDLSRFVEAKSNIRTEDPINKLESEGESATQAAAERVEVQHVEELQDPRLTQQDLKNVQVVGRVSGFDLWPNQKHGVPLWVFVAPGTQETAALLSRIDNMPKIEGIEIRPIVIPVAISESEIKKTVSTICVDGKTDPITTVPPAWRAGVMPAHTPSGCSRV